MSDGCALREWCSNRVKTMKSIKVYLIYVCMCFLQGSGCGNHQSWTGRCLEICILELFLFCYLCYIDREYGVLCCVAVSWIYVVHLFLITAFFFLEWGFLVHKISLMFFFLEWGLLMHNIFFLALAQIYQFFFWIWFILLRTVETQCIEENKSWGYSVFINLLKI